MHTTPAKSKNFEIKPPGELGCELQSVICHFSFGSAQDPGEERPRRNRRNTHPVTVTSAQMLRPPRQKRAGRPDAGQRPEEFN